MHAATLVRSLEARVGALDELIERSHGAAAHAKGEQLLAVTARSLGESAEALDDGGPDPDTAPVEAGLSQYVRWREAPLGRESDPALRFRLRFAIAAEELTVWTRDLAASSSGSCPRRTPCSRRLPSPSYRQVRPALM